MHVTRRLLIGIVVALALVLSACADDTGETTADETTTDETTTDDTDDTDTDDTDATEDDAAAGDPSEDAADAEDAAGDGDGDDEAMAGATVGVASSSLGDIVVDGEGRTLYMFVPDDGGEPTCTDACAETWPVFEGPATADEGADESLLSTATHPSGATQVTYGGWPLYYFASDAAAGDTNGQGINDVWFVIGPDGEPIRDAAAASGRGLGY